MQYEIYLDVFFLNNFMMDYLILLAVRKTLKCTATYGYVLLGAGVGAAFACGMVLLPLGNFERTLFMHFLGNSLMLWTSLKPENMREFLKAWILLYILSFFMGGIMGWMKQYLSWNFREGTFFITATIISYYLFSRGINFLKTLYQRQNFRCSVTLCYGKNVCTFRAVIDSGNSLFDSLTCKPVHIIDEKAIKRLINNERIQNVRYISYSTIQEKEAILPVIMIDKMCIHEEKEKKVDSPLLGISSKRCFGNGSYDVILHPDEC